MCWCVLYWMVQQSLFRKNVFDDEPLGADAEKVEQSAHKSEQVEQSADAEQVDEAERFYTLR